MDYAFDIVSKKSSPNARSSTLDFFLLCYLLSFILLHFTFSLVIYFELIFVKSVKCMCSFFCFACGCPFVPASFLYCVSPFLFCQRSSTVDSICVDLFLVSLYPFLNLSIYYANSTLSWLLTRFIVSLKVGYYLSPAFAFLILCWLFWVVCLPYKL